MTTGFVVLANASAGSADDEALRAVAGRLRAVGPVELARSGSGGEVDEVLAGLAGRVLVVAGGDGSVHTAVGRLRALGLASSAAVGLVPLGTGNDLARGSGVPLDPVEAAELIASGNPARPADLLVDDAGGVVVNAAHAGLGAEAADRSDSLKGSLGPLAYPLGALIAGVRESGWDLEVVADGAVVHRGAALMVGVGNGPSIGGGTELFPGARLDDGLADVVVVTAVGPAARAAFAAALRSGTHVDRDDVVALRAADVALSGDPVRHNTDGEVGDEVVRRRYTVEAGAWRLVRP
ncbi:MAG TPA: diacylglycerol kinase family protein [Acidimicrobiales bacterium]